jgi:hypothetical protein
MLFIYPFSFLEWHLVADGYRYKFSGLLRNFVLISICLLISRYLVTVQIFCWSISNVINAF